MEINRIYEVLKDGGRLSTKKLKKVFRIRTSQPYKDTRKRYDLFGEEASAPKKAGKPS